MKGSGPACSKCKTPPPPLPPPPPKKNVMFSSETKGNSHMSEDKSDTNSSTYNYISNKKRRDAVGAYHVRQYEEERRQYIEDFSRRKRQKINGGAHTRRKRLASARNRKRTTRKRGRRGKKTRKVRTHVKRNTGGASVEQIGRAAAMRTDVDKKTSRELSKIVHSGDRTPHKMGNNEFADRNNSFSHAAEYVITQRR